MTANPDSESKPVRENRLTPQQAAEAFAQGILLIDVRADAGRERDGTIEGTVHVQKADVAAALTIGSPTHLSQFKSPDQKVVLFCTSEKGTDPLLDQLAERGLTNVSDVAGGYAAWKAAGLPTTSAA